MLDETKGSDTSHAPLLLADSRLVPRVKPEPCSRQMGSLSRQGEELGLGGTNQNAWTKLETTQA